MCSVWPTFNLSIHFLNTRLSQCQLWARLWSRWDKWSAGNSITPWSKRSTAHRVWIELHDNWKEISNWRSISQKSLFLILDFTSYLPGPYLSNLAHNYPSTWQSIISAWPEFKFWFCHLLAMWPGASVLTALYLGFFICKLGMVMPKRPTFRGLWED